MSTHNSEVRRNENIKRAQKAARKKTIARLPKWDLIKAIRRAEG
jgi:hypothetical protein